MKKLIAVGAVLMACSFSLLGAQDLQPKSQTVVFHVTAVHHTDEASVCKSGLCSTTKYTIEGFAEMEHNVSVTEYVLTCDEFAASLPHPHRNNICARLHAGNAYQVELLSDSVSFPFSRLNKDFEANYRIMSEREAARGMEQLLSQNNR
jgi:hypothetical protein